MKKVSQIVLFAAALFAPIVPLDGQEVSFRAGAGAVFGSGGAGERYRPGPSAIVSVEHQLTNTLGVRVDGEWSFMKGEDPEAFVNPDMRIYALSLNGVFRLSGEPIAAYLLAGAGAYRLEPVGGDLLGVSRTSPALRAGIGIDAHFWERIATFAEVRAVQTLSQPMVFWPVVIGIRLHGPP